MSSAPVGSEDPSHPSLQFSLNPHPRTGLPVPSLNLRDMGYLLIWPDGFSYLHIFAVVETAQYGYHGNHLSALKPSDPKLFQSDQTSRINLACLRYHPAFWCGLLVVSASFCCLFHCKHGGELEITAERFQEHHTGLEKTYLRGELGHSLSPPGTLREN